MFLLLLSCEILYRRECCESQCFCAEHWSSPPVRGDTGVVSTYQKIRCFFKLPDTTDVGVKQLRPRVTSPTVDSEASVGRGKHMLITPNSGGGGLVATTPLTLLVCYGRSLWGMVGVLVHSILHCDPCEATF